MALVFQFNLQLILNLVWKKAYTKRNCAVTIYIFKGIKIYVYIAQPRNIHAKNHSNWSRRLVVIVREIHRRNNEPKTEMLLPSVKYYPSV